ncbi:MAG TPA: hypothetical protein VGR59_05680, partial [Gemmatimonadaceae bacterium]|nr:hypothetical protein [Gemmatimonadaceae bacterium]
GTLFGTGKIIFGYPEQGVMLLVIALAAFIWIARSFRSEGADTPKPVSVGAASPVAAGSDD